MLFLLTLSTGVGIIPKLSSLFLMIIRQYSTALEKYMWSHMNRPPSAKETGYPPVKEGILDDDAAAIFFSLLVRIHLR